MTNKIAGFALGLAAAGMMLGLMSLEVSNLHAWNEVSTPAFVAKFMSHAASTVMAFLGGKLIPTEPKTQRIGDEK